MTDFTVQLHSVIDGYYIDGAKVFAKVFKGHPNNLMPSGGKPLARWYTNGTIDPPEGQGNLKNQRQQVAVFIVQCYWPLGGVEGAQKSQEDDIANVMIGLPALFNAITPNTYTIGGLLVALVTTAGTQPVNRDFIFPTSDTEGIVLTLTVHARILEA